MTAREWEGLNIGHNDVIRIQTTTNSRFRNGSGDVSAEAFFAALANGQRVETEGSFDPATDTLRAVKVKIEHDHDDDDDGGDDDGGHG